MQMHDDVKAIVRDNNKQKRTHRREMNERNKCGDHEARAAKVNKKQGNF